MKLKRIQNSEYTINSDGMIFDASGALVSLSSKNGFSVVKVITTDNVVVNYKVHRLVAETFLPNPENLKYIIHKNKNKQDNRVENIYWSKTAYQEGTDLTSKNALPKKIEYAQCLQCKNEFIKTSKRKQFCSLNCGNGFKASRAGRISAQKVVNRSQNEILFANKCISYFGQENVLTNQAIFNGWDADVILTHLKIAILWNGKWHYETLRKGHNLNQVQNRDKIKEKEILSKGYKVVIIKDLGKFSISKVEEEFKQLLFNIP